MWSTTIMISTSIPPGETFSLFHFGAGTIKLEIACNGAAQSVTQMRMMILMIMIMMTDDDKNLHLLVDSTVAGWRRTHQGLNHIILIRSS